MWPYCKLIASLLCSTSTALREIAASRLADRDMPPDTSTTLAMSLDISEEACRMQTRIVRIATRRASCGQ